MLIPLSDMASCFCVRVLRALAISSELEEFLSLLDSTGREPYFIEVTFCNVIEYFSPFFSIFINVAPASLQESTAVCAWDFDFTPQTSKDPLIPTHVRSRCFVYQGERSSQ